MNLIFLSELHDKLHYKNHLLQELPLLTRLGTKLRQTNIHSPCFDMLCGSNFCVNVNDITDQGSRSKQNKNRKH